MSQKVLVVGDELQDLWIEGEMTRVSAEAPIGVVKARESSLLPGGAGNVKANLLALGVEAKIVKLTGDLPLPTKARVLVNGVQVCRVDFDDECSPITAEHIRQVTANESFAAIVVSDYGKGAIVAETLQAIEKLGLPTFVDTHGDPSVYWGVASVLFPNGAEYDRWEAEYNRFPNVVVKCGDEGIVRLIHGDAVQYEAPRAVKVQSVCGAGDSVLAGFVAAYLDGANIAECTAFANRAGAAAVGQPLTTAVTREMLGSV